MVKRLFYRYFYDLIQATCRTQPKKIIVRLHLYFKKQLINSLAPFHSLINIKVLSVGMTQKNLDHSQANAKKMNSLSLINLSKYRPKRQLNPFEEWIEEILIKVQSGELDIQEMEYLDIMRYSQGLLIFKSNFPKFDQHQYEVQVRCNQLQDNPSLRKKIKKRNLQKKKESEKVKQKSEEGEQTTLFSSCRNWVVKNISKVSQLFKKTTSRFTFVDTEGQKQGLIGNSSSKDQ